MASRAAVASSAAKRTARLAALAIIEGEPLPLPTEPREDPATYSDQIPAEVIQLGACGLSESQIAAHLAIDVDELRAWGEAHSVLKAALSRARTAMRAWWEEKARRAIVTGDNRFPAGAWSQVMRARFSEYDDKASVSVHLDLSQLVMVSRRAPELPSEQTVSGRNQLIEHAPVRLSTSPTASDDPDQQADQAHRPGTDREG